MHSHFIRAEKFRVTLNELFNYDQAIDCGFVTLHNSIDLSTNGNLARAGFSQREKVSPLYLGMVSNGVITGEIKKPYIINNTVDTQTVETIKSIASVETVCNIPAEYIIDTKGGMIDVASDLNLVVNELTIYAKTGTAEVSDDESKKDIHYIIATISDDEYNIKNIETVVFLYVNSPNTYASGDSPQQEVLHNE